MSYVGCGEKGSEKLNVEILSEQADKIKIRQKSSDLKSQTPINIFLTKTGSKKSKLTGI